MKRAPASLKAAVTAASPGSSRTGRGLGRRIFLSTSLPLLALSALTLWLVGAAVTRQADRQLREDLERASLVFEQILSARAGELAAAGASLSLDSKFRGAWDALPARPGSAAGGAGAGDDATGLVREWNEHAALDILDVYDARGVERVNGGRFPDGDVETTALVAEALRGRTAYGVVLRADSPYQVAAVPLLRNGRPAGAILCGERMGQALAHRLAVLTRTEVSFVAGRAVRVSTLADLGDRYRLVQDLSQARARHPMARDARLLESQTSRGRALTLSRPFPGAGTRASYALQRSVEEETLYLRRVYRDLAGLAVAAFLAALISAWLVARSITRPIARLVDAAQALEGGDYEHPLDVRSRDEIGLLARTFLGMRRHLQCQVQGLEELGRIKSEFLSVASHELRTPLTIIQGYQSLLAERALGPLTSPQDSAVLAIGQGAETLHKLAEDAGRLAEIDQVQFKPDLAPFDVSEMLARAVRCSLEAGPGRKVAVRHEVAPGAEFAVVDGPRLLHAISKLVENGIRFTRDGGEVVLRARRDGGLLRVEVRDTGVGIPADQLEGLFDKTFALRSSTEHHSSSTLEFGSAGLGLGLCIAQGVARAHGGDVFVESEVGRGTTVTLIVPAEGMQQAA
ncbi:MAG: HAMP domain-containing histidine kinase [Candidatus Eisenbacteria bacterium]|nr:HAMP domain-containing histidine kinase [Candidatus Eisenbacteria bacterium]